jgi:hypothetical protein
MSPSGIIIQTLPDPEIKISKTNPFEATSIYVLHKTHGLVSKFLRLEIEVCGLEKI